MWVPHKEKKNKTKHQKQKEEMANGQFTKFCFFLIFFFIFFSSLYFVLRFTSFGPSEFVGINTESVLHDEGYA